MKVIRRLGKTPMERGDTTDLTGSPDVLELDDGSFAVIGVDVTEDLGRQPLADARCADGERIVLISRSTLIAAKEHIPDE